MLIIAILVEVFLAVQSIAYLVKADLAGTAMAKISYAMLGVIELLCLIMLVSYTVIWDSLSRIKKLVQREGHTEADTVLRFFGVYIGILVIFFAGIIATLIRTLNAAHLTP